MSLRIDKVQPDPERPRLRGRPRRSETEHVILGAAVDILRREGLQGFTVSAVAARSGSSRTTVYRRWPSREVLLLDVLSHVFARETIALDGDLMTTLSAIGRERAEVLSNQAFLAALPLVVQLAVDGTDLSSRARQQLLSPYREAFVRSWIDLTGRNLIRGGTDPDLLLSMLVGAILYRTLLDERVGSLEIDQLTMLILAAALPPTPQQ